MPDVPPAAHAMILRQLRSALDDVTALREATAQIPTGYMGFETAATTLSACHEALASIRDKAQIIAKLKLADASVAMIGGGAVAPARSHEAKAPAALSRARTADLERLGDGAVLLIWRRVLLRNSRIPT